SSDLTTTSPTSPNSASSSVPIFTIFESVSGQGTPILPLTRLPQTKFACVTGDDSVSPYPSTSVPPVTFSKFCCISTGNGADPLIHASMDDKSYLCISGWFNKPT